ncbi:ataxin-3 [Neodiprion pinetum]|uniref:ubiquitinyl hydrolase 1 n=1 Tax=Neodiprion lecontei TaxID=441921 RepID=A0A6J0C8M6_NEOLC|nr:ataxin-3 [Neodiprion lecontei]XP_046413609.1 ataxin-3-like [Neodiprion fabricii]XP_046468033.1 ataxin-3-like [Neodiprion pinetum]XP_046605964.1 ataxin-3-like [Neodiprion virginianus]
MESIFHEKQEGYLCAQHCLNALLQGPYFNAVDLANLACQMDEEERLRMAESGIDSEEYQLFLEQPSGNMDDSGYFSVQVISSALKVWGLELIPYNSTEATALMAQNDPSDMNAYICNYKGHWFTIRKLGKQWFNLNSMLSGPQLISNTYLAMYLAQLMQEGYSIFIVIGSLPECVAEDVITKNPITATPRVKARSNDCVGTSGMGYRLGSKEEEDAKILKTALALGEVKVPNSCVRLASTSSIATAVSRMSQKNHSDIASETGKPRERIIPIRIEGRDQPTVEEEDDADLQKALKLSLQDANVGVDESSNLRLDPSNDKADKYLPNSNEDTDEDEDLRRALQLSLECMTTPSTPDPDDLRWRRLAFLGIHNSDSTQKLNT